VKKILLILLVFIPFISFGQSVVPQGNDHTMTINKGGFQADSVLFIPHRNDNSWYGRYGDLRINPTSGNLEFRKAGQWVEVGQSAQAEHHLVEYFQGMPITPTAFYTLSHYAIGISMKVYVNGELLPQTYWSFATNNQFRIESGLFYPIDNTDVITVSYSYY